jgi:hypothetical protein
MHCREAMSKTLSFVCRLRNRLRCEVSLGWPFARSLLEYWGRRWREAWPRQPAARECRGPAPPLSSASMRAHFLRAALRGHGTKRVSPVWQLHGCAPYLHCWLHLFSLMLASPAWQRCGHRLGRLLCPLSKLECDPHQCSRAFVCCARGVSVVDVRRHFPTHCSSNSAQPPPPSRTSFVSCTHCTTRLPTADA